MVFKNEAQLRKFLADKCAAAVDSAKEKVHHEFADNLNQFYAEFKPEEYIRTEALLHSLEVTDTKRVGNQHMSLATAEIYFNTPSYKHGWLQLQSGDFDYSSWSDETIQNVVMTGSYSGLPHGGYESGTAIWTDSLTNLGGKRGINNLLKQELKKQGL